MIHLPHIHLPVSPRPSALMIGFVLMSAIRVYSQVLIPEPAAAPIRIHRVVVNSSFTTGIDTNDPWLSRYVFTWRMPNGITWHSSQPVVDSIATGTSSYTFSPLPVGTNTITVAKVWMNGVASNQFTTNIVTGWAVDLTNLPAAPFIIQSSFDLALWTNEATVTSSMKFYRVLTN
jgi:hypothetical protein